MSTTNKENTLEAMFKKSGGIVVNDHTGKKEHLEALMKLENGSWTGVITKHDLPAYQSLNLIYINYRDNLLHLSECSVGGDFPNWSGQVILNVIRRYNEFQTFSGTRIDEVIFADGNLITNISGSEESKKKENISQWCH